MCRHHLIPLLAITVASWPVSSASAAAPVRHHSANIGANQTWTADSVHVIDSDISVLPGVTLTIQAGAAVKFAGTGGTANAGLFVGGTLTALGTDTQPIYFTSLRDDAAGPGNLPDDTNGDGSGTTPAAGNWERIQFTSTSTGSTLEYCVIRYGGTFGNPGNNPMIEVIGSSPGFNECTVSKSASNGLSVTTGGTPTMSNSSLTDCNNYAIIVSLDSDPVFTAVTATGNLNGNGIQINGGTLSVNRRWRNMGLVYIVTADLSVAPGTTLTVDPGVAVKFAGTGGTANAGLFVGGTLTALGTYTQPIYFTSLRDDAGGPGNLPHDTNGDGSSTTPAAGNWERIQFSSTSTGSTLEYCVIRYGGTFGNPGNNPMIDVIGSSPTILNGMISNGQSPLIGCSSDANPVIHYSSILASTTVFGINNTSTTVTIDATMNWWGSPTGPYDPSTGPPDHNPTGLGSRVSDYVAYRPWLMEPPPTGTPAIRVSPDRFIETSLNRQLVTVPLKIKNSGQGALHFTLSEGASGTATNDASPAAVDLPWLDQTPKSGSILGGDSVIVSVLLDGSIVPDARYDGYLIIDNSDGTRSPLTIPVTFYVGVFSVDVPMDGSEPEFGFAGVYPVPAGDRLTVSLRLSPGPASLHVVDLGGRTVLREDLSIGSDERVVSVDLLRSSQDRLAPGIYFLQLRQDRRMATRRICVLK